MLSAATSVRVGTITVTMKCPVCEETNMALSAILSDDDAAAWRANAYRRERFDSIAGTIRVLPGRTDPMFLDRQRIVLPSPPASCFGLLSAA